MKIFLDNNMKLILKSLEESPTILGLISEKGLHLQSQNLDNTFLQTIYLNANSFETFAYEREFRFLLDEDDKEKFIKELSSKSNILLSFEYDDDIDFINLKMNKLTLSLYEDNHRIMNVEKLKIPSIVSLYSKDFKKLVYDLMKFLSSHEKIIHQKFILENTSKGLIIKWDDDEKIQSKIVYRMFSQNVLNWSAKESNFIRIRGEPLYNILKNISLLPIIDIEIGSYMPMRYIQKFGTNKLIYVISPVLNEDDKDNANEARRKLNLKIPK